MNKAELIERIIDAITDPWNEYPFDYEDLTPLNLEEATGYLAELRRDEDLSDLDPEDRLPAAVTPELYMEAFNCHLRHMKHECHIIRLAKYLTDNECVCEYDQYRNEYHHSDPEVVPTDWLFNEYATEGFPFAITDCDGEEYKPDLAYIFRLGLNSANTFNMNDIYMWFNRKSFRLESTNTPFHDGIIHARPFAEFILGPNGHEALDYFVNTLLDEDEIRWIFHCDAIEVMDLYSFS